MEESRVTAEEINKELIYKSFDVKVFRSLKSTNNTAKEMALNGASEGILIVAESQTSGRGRMDRSFHSPQGSGIYFSLVLRPNMTGEDAVLLTTAAAVAVCRTVEKLSQRKAQIKWVNDIFVDGKKVCGILAESAFKTDGKIDYVVLGIGANISPPTSGFPDSIKNIAGTVFEESTSDMRSIFVGCAVNAFYEIYKDLKSLQFCDEYKKRSIVMGRKITFEKSGILKSARVVDIDKKCRLVVEYENGERDALSSGEVSIGSGNIV